MANGERVLDALGEWLIDAVGEADICEDCCGGGVAPHNGVVEDIIAVNGKPTLLYNSWTWVAGLPTVNNGHAIVMSTTTTPPTVWYAPLLVPTGNLAWTAMMDTLGPSAGLAGHVVVGNGGGAGVYIANQLNDPTSWTKVYNLPGGFGTNHLLQFGKTAVNDRIMMQTDRKQVIVSDNANLSAWTPVTASPAFGAPPQGPGASNGTRPQVVNGFPSTASSGGLFFQATNTIGTTWGAGVAFAPLLAVNRIYRIRIVAGYPAILFSVAGGTISNYVDELYYVRALDANGATWGTPVQVPLAAGAGVTDPANIVGGFRAADMDIDGSGTIYARWWSVDSDVILGAPSVISICSTPLYWLPPACFSYTTYPDATYWIVIYGSQSVDNGVTWSSYTWEYQIELTTVAQKALTRFYRVSCYHDGTDLLVAYSTNREAIQGNPLVPDFLSEIMYINGVIVS